MSTEQKYYLISYSYVERDCGVLFDNIIERQHPIDWINYMKKFEETMDKKEYRFSKFNLINFWEITEEQFYNFNEEN